MSVVEHKRAREEEDEAEGEAGKSQRTVAEFFCPFEHFLGSQLLQLLIVPHLGVCERGRLAQCSRWLRDTLCMSWERCKIFVDVFMQPGNGESGLERTKQANIVAGTRYDWREPLKLVAKNIIKCRGNKGKKTCGKVAQIMFPSLRCGSCDNKSNMPEGNFKEALQERNTFLRRIQDAQRHHHHHRQKAQRNADREDARFQILCKYSANGYDSPREMMENEPDMAEIAGLDIDDFSSGGYDDDDDYYY